MGDKLIRNPKDVIIEGVDLVADFVGASMGSKGRFIIINDGQKAFATKDGYSIAKEIQPEGDVEPIVKIMQDASNVAVKLSGDGTTGTMVLTQSLTKRLLELEGSNSIDVNRGIDLAVKEIASKLSDKSVDITENSKALRDVAIVSANNDEELATIISEALEEVTKDGMVNVVYSKSAETYTEYRNGMELGTKIDANFTERDVIPVMNNANILMCEDDIKSFDELKPAMAASFAEEKPLVVIANKIEGQALATVISNLRVNTENSLLNKIVLINLDEFGQAMIDTLGDIATLTGGKVVKSSLGHSLKSFDKSFFGRAEQVGFNRSTTAIIGGDCDKEEVDSRVEQIREMKEEESDSHIRSIYGRRIARLVGGLATIFIGGNTDAEKRERKDRVDDALLAVASALAEGVVVGGGTFLLKAEDALEGLKSDNKDIMLGIDIMRQCLDAPTRKMMSNAGLSNADELIGEVKNRDYNYGYNLETNEIVDLVEDGIIDPAKVIRVSLEAAVSAAKIFSNSFGIITNKV